MSSLIKNSSPSSGFNLPNGGFEEGIKGYRVYKDALLSTPEDGIGGSPAYVSISASSVNPLLDLNSGVINKALGNGKGEGVSIDFTIDKANVDRPCILSFYFESSANYATNDIGIYLYDITNSIVYSPSVVGLSNSVGVSTYKGTCYFNTTSSQYRLIFHVRSENTLAYTIKLDNIEFDYNTDVIGSVIGEWTDYTLTVGATTTAPTFGTTPTRRASWRRVGSNAEIGIALETSTAGTDGSGDYLVSMPPGVTIDLTKVKVGQRLGSSVIGAGPDPMVSTTRNGLIEIYSSTQFKLVEVKDNNTLNMDYWSSAFFSLANVTLRVYADFSVPISGWVSNVNLITDFQEFAFNTSNSINSDLTSFGYGPEGASGIIGVNNLGNNVLKRVRFKKPIQSTDKIEVEIYDPTTKVWVSNYVSSAGYPIVNGYQAGDRDGGICVRPFSSTDVDVLFWITPYGNSGLGWAHASFSGVKWRVRKISNGNSAESIPSGIYESGSNANGSWVKYIDGTLKQWGWGYVTCPGGASFYEATKTLPVPFVGSYDIVASTIGSSSLASPTSRLDFTSSAGAFAGASPLADASTFKAVARWTTNFGAANYQTGYSFVAEGRWNTALQVYAPGALVGITIEESGSNSNGRYIKYSDGTMICYSSITVGAGITAVVPFPASYLSTPICTGTPGVNSGSAVTFRTLPYNQTITGFTIYGAGSPLIQWIAIGKWK
jgi:hypothetical protein